MHPIVGRIIVIAKHENWIYYCHNMYVPTNDFYGFFSDKFTMCRILNYERETSTLWIKTETPLKQSKDNYLISSEVNIEIFKDNPVRKIILNNASRQPFNNKSTIKNAPKKEIELHEYDIDIQVPIEDFVQINEVNERYIEFRKLKPISELTFNDSSISFEQYCSEINRVETFSIENNFIRKEFDSIKNYFSKFFPNGKVDVICRLKLSNSDVLEINASSDDILKINQDTITRIEDDLIRDSILNKDTEEIRSLEDAFNDAYPVLEDKSIEWLMTKLAQEEITKHHRHLLYLSNRHDKSLFKLKVTGKPISYLFGIREHEDIYIIWETHNTKEATYIWKHDKFNNELQEFIEDIDEQVKKLRQRTKREYRLLNKNNPHFWVIEHDYNSSDNGFEKWKDQLIKYLTT